MLVRYGLKPDNFLAIGINCSAAQSCGRRLANDLRFRPGREPFIPAHVVLYHLSRDRTVVDLPIS